MKKIYTLVAALMVTIGTWAYEFPGFEWTVGADVTTTYLWRGLNLGGLALQPDVMVGYGGLKLEGWANISPKDYTRSTDSQSVQHTTTILTAPGISTTEHRLWLTIRQVTMLLTKRKYSLSSNWASWLRKCL